MPTKCLALPGVDTDGQPKLSDIGRPRIQDGCLRCSSRGPPQTRVEVHAMGLDYHATDVGNHNSLTLEAHVLRMGGQYASITPPRSRYGQPRNTHGLPDNPRGEPHVLDGSPTQHDGRSHTITWTAKARRFGCPHTPGDARPMSRVWTSTALGHDSRIGRPKVGWSRKGCRHPQGRLVCSWTPIRSGLARPGRYVANLTRLCGPSNWPHQVLWACTCRLGRNLHGRCVVDAWTRCTDGHVHVVRRCVWYVLPGVFCGRATR
jgi:hypothetical protein